jgi:cation transport ATPase
LLNIFIIIVVIVSVVTFVWAQFGPGTSWFMVYQCHCGIDNACPCAGLATPMSVMVGVGKEQSGVDKKTQKHLKI